MNIYVQAGGVRMFFERLDEELAKKDFVQFPVSQQGLIAYEKTENDSRVFIVFVNLPDEITEDVMNLRYSLQQVKFQLNCTEQDKFLFVYLTDTPDRIAILCEDTRDTHWVIDRRELRLVIYEHQPGDFYEVRKSIENTLHPPKVPRKKFTAYVTAGIIGINVLIYFIMFLVCSNEQREMIEAWGGLFWPYVTRQHEYWRLITSMFIHSDISHLFNNMLLLFFIGEYLEDYVGHWKFAVLYFGTGILADMVSMGYNILGNRMVLSIGASGAIYGVVGALAGFIFLSKGMIKDITGPRLVVFIGLSILGGFQSEGVDNMAHIGGLISGVLLALLLTICSNHKQKKVANS